MTREEVKAQLVKCPLEWDCTDPMKERGFEVVRHYAGFVEISCDADIYFTVKEVRDEDGAMIDAMLCLSAIDVVQYAYSPYDIIIETSIAGVAELKAKAEEKRLSMACRMLGINY